MADIRKNVLSYDYFKLAEDKSIGLERTATLAAPDGHVHRERGHDAQALVWLRRAAASEHREANLALAIVYRNGELGLR